MMSDCTSDDVIVVDDHVVVVNTDDRLRRFPTKQLDVVVSDLAVALSGAALLPAVSGVVIGGGGRRDEDTAAAAVDEGSCFFS